MKESEIFSRKSLILLKALVKTDFKLRYQGSVLGYLWAIIRPLLMFAILFIVFDKILHLGGNIPNYSVYLLTGTVLWSFFIECTNQGIQSVVGRGELLRKINFPKYIVVIAATITAVINLLINIGVVIFFATLSGVQPQLSWLLIIIPIVELYLFSLGISLLLGAINVKLRDISSIWEVLSQALFYAIPIIYPVSMVAERSIKAAEILLLNPIAQAIQDARFFIMPKHTITTWGFIPNAALKITPIILVITTLVIAVLYFKKHAKKFAEEV